ncbi:MAG: hypothetical protein L0099_11510 [Acidobacteria bacterium]|nr:hypothetical protein [Acidobacteriota bacterium]
MVPYGQMPEVGEPRCTSVTSAPGTMEERVRTCYVGPEEPSNNRRLDQCFHGKAGEVLPGLVSA